MTNINKFTLSLLSLYTVFIGVCLAGSSIFWPFNNLPDEYRWAAGILGLFFIWLGGFSGVDEEKKKIETQVKTLKLKTTSKETAIDIIQELNRFSEESMLDRFKNISKKYSNNTSLILTGNHFHNIMIEGKEVMSMIKSLDAHGLCPKPYKYTYNNTDYYMVIYLSGKRNIES